MGREEGPGSNLSLQTNGAQVPLGSAGLEGPCSGEPLPKPLRFQHPKSSSSRPAPPVSSVLLCAGIKARASTSGIPTFAAGCALILPSAPGTAHSLLIKQCFLLELHTYQLARPSQADSHAPGDG